jgi:hypothetical protein
VRRRGVLAMVSHQLDGFMHDTIGKRTIAKWEVQPT